MPAKPLLATTILALLCLAAPVGAATLPAPILDTVITEGPGDGAAIENERPTFSFGATLAEVGYDGAVFNCSLDNAPAEPCASPFQTAQLEDGPHLFSVYAEDPQSLLADATPAQSSFVIVSPEEECEGLEDEEELEEEDEGECEEAGDDRLPPEECLLRTARARLFTYSSQNRVRLVLRYTSFEPAEVFVDYRLAGGRGALRLGSAHQRFAKKGVFRLSEQLADGEMDKVRAARRVTVSMTIPEAPRYCRRYDTRQLTIKRAMHSQIVWFQSDSIFGA